ncbi:unnamed protein product [Paramecium sonneborni]|uniref:Uncharacterized protein n=1 Tax=Paramecium sonneborni TaxID=65129 RepID=A0A8S1L5R8_9CILI|nr:unnamed protein product [Paramecium sonneborni]
MNNEIRQYIRPITRKLKKKPQNIIVCQDDEVKFDFGYFDNDSDDIQTLIEDFQGKCILLPNTSESDSNEEKQKKNKIGENKFSDLNQVSLIEPTSIENKLQKIQQNLDQDDNLSNLETQSNLTDDENFGRNEYKLGLQGEINYLEGLPINNKTRFKKKKNLVQQNKQKINKKLLLQKIQSKKIIKSNKKE